jgi:hypothetical protein
MRKHPIIKFLLVSIIFITSCTKEYSFEKQKQEVYFITCKVDGVLKEYFNCLAGDHTDPSNGNLSIYGAAPLTNSNNPGFFALEIASHTQVVTEGEYADSTTGFQAHSVYVDSVSNEVYVSGSNLQIAAAGSGITIPDHLKITVTELGEFTVRGTFSGDFYLNGDISGKMIKITDGLFYLKMN